MMDTAKLEVAGGLASAASSDSRMGKEARSMLDCTQVKLLGWSR